MASCICSCCGCILSYHSMHALICQNACSLKSACMFACCKMLLISMHVCILQDASCLGTACMSACCWIHFAMCQHACCHSALCVLLCCRMHTVLFRVACSHATLLCHCVMSCNVALQVTFSCCSLPCLLFLFPCLQPRHSDTLFWMQTPSRCRVT